jgi:hypothetical protein
MATRNPTMSLYNSNEDPERWHLVRRVVLLLLLVVALSLGLVILFRQKSGIPLLLFDVLADVSLGLLIGLGTRIVLRHRHWFIQGVASTALVLIGLAVLGYFTDWKSGIGPWQIGLIKVNWLDWAHISLQLPLQFGRSRMDVFDLAHMIIAIDTSWIALRAWKRSMSFSGQMSSSSPRIRSRARAHPVRASVSSNASVANVRSSAAVSSPGPRVKKKKSTGRPVISMRTADPRPSRSRTRAWNPLHRKHEVQFAVYEEHRCPYCLEVVTRDDPRGSVECQVCHALHHKDCWDITGTCQVPHLNT